MNIQEVYKKLSDDLVNAFNFFIGNMKLTKLFKATIIEKIDDTVYKVSYKNVEYKVKSYYDLIIGDIVWVCAPGGDWDSLFVQSYSGFLDRIITIDRVVNNLTTDVAGTVLDGRMGRDLKKQLDIINTNLEKLSWVSVATNIPTGGATSNTWISLQENTENYKELRFVFGSPKGGTQTGWFEYRTRKWLESDWQIDKIGSNYGRIRIPQPDGTDCSLEMRTDNGFLIRTTSTNYALRAVYARKG